MRIVSLLLLLGATACAPARREPATTAEPTTSTARAGRAFGAPIDPATPNVTLAELIAAPERYREQVVRTEGTIVRVCQRMGCWMEIADGDGPAVRAPMAGHAFFLPRDVQGRRAEVQARVLMTELDEAEREHLASEGAAALASPLTLEALGVVLTE